MDKRGRAREMRDSSQRLVGADHVLDREIKPKEDSWEVSSKSEAERRERGGNAEQQRIERALLGKQALSHANECKDSNTLTREVSRVVETVSTTMRILKKMRGVHS